MADASRVLLASAGRLAWYRYDTDELRVLHEGAVSVQGAGGHMRHAHVMLARVSRLNCGNVGAIAARAPVALDSISSLLLCPAVPQGSYYGAFTGGERDVLGGPATLWVVSRPATAGSHDELLHLGLDSGKELGRTQVGSLGPGESRQPSKQLGAGGGTGRQAAGGGPGLVLAGRRWLPHRLQTCKDAWGTGQAGSLALLHHACLPAHPPPPPCTLSPAGLCVHARCCAAAGACVRGQHRGWAGA